MIKKTNNIQQLYIYLMIRMLIYLIILLMIQIDDNKIIDYKKDTNLYDNSNGKYNYDALFYRRNE